MDGILTQMELDNEKNSVAARSFTKFPSQAWIIPPDFDHSEAEAKVISIVNHHILLFNILMHSFHKISQHLVFESDVDGDGHLTKEEILEKYDLFVGSQVSFAQ